MKLVILFFTTWVIYQKVFCCPSSPDEKHSNSQTMTAKTDSGLQTTKSKTDSDQSKEPSKYD